MSTTFSRAQQLHAAGQLDAALPLYEQCLRDAPGDWRALTRLGLLRLQHLDPFPYNGSTTTCDALTMGVPVVTRAGVGLAARAGLMFLTACGMQEWVARDEREYVRLACDAARDVQRLSVLRPKLRARFLASSACDAPRFARALEGIYREVWRRFAAVDRPAG